MALFSALTLAGIMSGQVPFAHLINAIFGTDIHYFGWEVPVLAAIVLTLIVMVIFAWGVQKYVFRHLVGQEPIILFMATIGLAFFMEGFSDLMWGSELKKLDVGIPQGGSFWWEDVTRSWVPDDPDYYGMYIDVLDVWAAIIAALLDQVDVI